MKALALAAVFALLAFALLAFPSEARSDVALERSPAVCPGPADPGTVRCHAQVLVRGGATPHASTSPTGLAPATIKNAYQFSTSLSSGAGSTIAIVDAYDDPSAESDLGVFSAQYGLPACTRANGCFAKVNQNGGTHYPKANASWTLEISLDIQWAHAIAPGAKIILVEASSNSFANLLAAEDYAKAHAQYVSNSWGASEFVGETAYDAHFAASGVSFFVSAGDAGLPAEYPSSSPKVRRGAVYPVDLASSVSRRP